MKRTLLFSIIAIVLLTALGAVVIITKRPGASVSGTSPGAAGVGVTTAADAAGGERLPCGHRVHDSRKGGEYIWADCVHGHAWEYGERGWYSSREFPSPQLTLPPPVMPSSEDLLPCGHRVQRSHKEGEALTAWCTQEHTYKQHSGRWQKT